MKQFVYKIFTLLPPHSAVDCISDWQGENFSPHQTTDNLEECLAQPYRVAAVPALFNQPGSYSYNQMLCAIDWSKFDLVLLSDIEYTNLELIQEYAAQAGIKNSLIALGGLTKRISEPDLVYRPWWIFQHMRLNSFQPHQGKKDFLFEALLGARRAHRSYVMSRFQLNADLLSQSIITYRKEFGYDDNNLDAFFDQNTVRLIEKNLVWPYVSPNLTPDMEVSDQILREISEITPWQIYNNTYYSICCETVFQHPEPSRYQDPGPFFITEKTAKVLLGQRLFVMFGPRHTLKFLKDLGFMTFDNVIDESYDDCDNAGERFKLAFDQVEYLSTLDPETVINQTQHIRLHNHNHLYQYRKDIRNQMHQMILDKIPEQYKFA
jgi:hypothetical protein